MDIAKLLRLREAESLDPGGLWLQGLHVQAAALLAQLKFALQLDIPF